MRTRSAKTLLAARSDHRIHERFWTKVEKGEDENGCWEWRGTVKPGGYPALQVGQHSISPSHLSWLWSTGEFPLGGRIQQVCNNQLCVRPSHLAWVVGRALEQRLAAESEGYLSVVGVPVTTDEPRPRTPRTLRLVAEPETADRAVETRCYCSVEPDLMSA
jgi:hypothetical protein